MLGLTLLKVRNLLTMAKVLYTIGKTESYTAWMDFPGKIEFIEP